MSSTRNRVSKSDPNTVNIIRIILPTSEKYNYTAYQACREDFRNPIEYRSDEWTRIRRKALKEQGSDTNFVLDNGIRVEIFSAYRTKDVRKLNNQPLFL